MGEVPGLKLIFYMKRSAWLHMLMHLLIHSAIHLRIAYFTSFKNILYLILNQGCVFCIGLRETER